MGYWHEPGDRLAPAGDDIFLARLDLANAAGEGLVGFAQADHLAHLSYPGQPRSRSEARSSGPKPISAGISRATGCPSRVMMYSSPASTSRTHCSKLPAASSSLIVFTALSIDPRYVAQACYTQGAQPLPSRSSVALTSASGTAILIPARSCWSSIATRESRFSQ